MITFYEIYLFLIILKYYILLQINNYFNIDNIEVYKSICQTLQINRPLFVKLGQILSSKNIGLDPIFMNELDKLKNTSFTSNLQIYNIRKN